jgi:hypothetical protein
MNKTYNSLGYSQEEAAIATGVMEDLRRPVNIKPVAQRHKPHRH